MTTNSATLTADDRFAGLLRLTFAKIARCLCFARVLSALDHRATAKLPRVRCGALHSSRTSTGSNNRARMACCPFKVEAGCLMLGAARRCSMAGLGAAVRILRWAAVVAAGIARTEFETRT